MHRCGGRGIRAVAFHPSPCVFFVPYPAGGGVDILARTLGEVVSKQWGQSVVIENRPGAGGVIASQALVASPPDGYTLIVVASGHATNPLLYPKIPYDTFKDFTPISLLASSPNILLVRADSPFKTLADMIAAARAKPGSLSFAHAGHRDVDASRRRTAEESRQGRSQCHSLQGRRARHQRSPGRADSDVVQQRPGIGRRSFRPARSARWRSPRPTRAPLLPNVPGMAETVPGYDTEVWWGLLGPAGMPPDLVAKLSLRFRRGAEYRAGEGAAWPSSAPCRSAARPKQFDEKIRADYENGGRSSRPPA